ncbi:hypothetical protein M8J76_010225 [Diaphorina citri]|nr:hypothetical protein M8J76_010225 [Diaphorina citri]
MRTICFWTIIVVIVMKKPCRSRASCDSEGCLNSFRFNLGSHVTWPSEKIKCEYKASGRYHPSNIIHTRAQMCGDKAFVLSPRYKCGVPYTVGEVCLTTSNKCHAVTRAYPCWEMHNECSCDAIQNAVDLYLDCKGILWVLDTGIVNTIGNPIKKCSPKVVGFHCETGRVMSYVQLCSLVCQTSRLQYITADYNADGGAFLYISDAATRALLVWDVKNERGYRVVLPKVLMAGGAKRDVLYLALIRSRCGSNLLYFTYLSSQRMYYVKTDHLQRHSSTGCIIDAGKKPGKMVVLGTDNGSVMFFRLHGENDIYMWNTELSFKPYYFILAQRGEDCRVATHVFPGYNKFMWVMESNFQDFLQGNVGCLGASTSIHPLMKPTTDF